MLLFFLWSFSQLPGSGPALGLSGSPCYISVSCHAHDVLQVAHIVPAQNAHVFIRLPLLDTLSAGRGVIICHSDRVVMHYLPNDYFLSSSGLEQYTFPIRYVLEIVFNQPCTLSILCHDLLFTSTSIFPINRARLLSTQPQNRATRPAEEDHSQGIGNIGTRVLFGIGLR
jgi:hypothetical protein